MDKKRLAAKKYLMQIQRLDREVDHHLLEIARLRALAAGVGSTANSERVQVSPTNKLESMIMKIVEAEEETDRMIDELFDKKKFIAKQIDCLPDSECADLLKFYFIDGVKFDDMPDVMKFSQRKVFYVYKKALIEFYDLFMEEIRQGF